MKQVVFVFALCTAMMAVRAQEGNNNCVWAAMNTFNTGGSATDLEPAIKCSDEAIANESTSGKWKAWYYRGQLFTLIAKDSVLRKQHFGASLEAANAFMKLRDLNDPKFKDWEDAANYILLLTTYLFPDGLKSYNAKDYATAYKQFYAVKQMNDILTSKSKRLPAYENAAVLRNASFAAKNSGNVALASATYKEWMTTTDTAAYSEYVEYLRKQNNIAEAKKVTDEGLVKYPKDAPLLSDKVNFFLADSNYVGALAFVNSLMAIDPKNLSLYLVKAQAYDNIGKGDSAIIFYEQATEINPKDSRAWNNIGAYYVNSARPMLEKMNNLGTSAEDTKKYNELKQQAKDLYTKAKPYLLKAKELEPNNESLTRTLKQVDAVLAE